jgi:probable HAF family extracellular repeat protein
VIVYALDVAECIGADTTMTVRLQLLELPAAVAGLTCFTSIGFAQVQFFEIPPLPGAQESTPMGVSGDGSVVFGHSGFIEGVDHAFRWTVGGGPEDLGTRPNTSTSFWEVYYAYGASDDGSTIVGVYADPVGSGEDHAFRWRPGVGMEDLGIGGADDSSAANGISADGAVIVGATSSEGAFRWTVDGIEYLGFGAANAVSADGNVVVGSSGSRAMRWTRQGGIQDVGGFSPVGCSSDGTVIVGTETGTTGPAIADRWTEGVGVVRLALPSNTSNAFPNAISGDGQTVVGDFAQGGTAACSWLGDAPAINLNQFLASHGISLDWSVGSATGISRDGQVIVGVGLHNGHFRGWMIRLSNHCGSADFNHDGDVGTDADIDAFFGVLAGSSCFGCESADFNGDGDVGTDADIEAFFRVLGGGSC